MKPLEPSKPVYGHAAFREATEDCLRPGGVALTARGLDLCGFSAGQRVADLGCGPGVTVRLLLRRGLRAVGVDVSPVMLAEAAQRLAEEPEAYPESSRDCPSGSLLAGRLERLPLRDACMDGLVCECVLSLSPEPERALADMARVLRPGGRLLLSDIIVRKGNVFAEDAANASGQGCARGAVTLALLRERLEHAGFQLVAVEDHSRLLAELAGRLLFQGVPRSALLDWMGRAGERTGGNPCGTADGCVCGRKRLGYAMVIGKKRLS